jgi:hypothetical protein
LVEVMVAASLGAMVLYVILNLLIPAMRVSTDGTTKVDLDQRATLLEERITRALKSTTHSGVGWVSDGNDRYLTTHPLIGTMTGSRQNWSAVLTVFKWSGSRLEEVEVNPPTNPAPVGAFAPGLAPDVLPLLEDARPKFVLEGIPEFGVTLQAGPQVDFDFTLEKGTQKLKVIRSVFLVNSSQ